MRTNQAKIWLPKWFIGIIVGLILCLSLFFVSEYKNYQFRNRILQEIRRNEDFAQMPSPIGSSPIYLTRYRIAYYYAEIKDYNRAIQECRKIVDDYPRNEIAPQAHYTIAKIYESLKDYNRAIQECRKIVDDYPKNEIAPQAQYQIGFLLKEQKKYQEAIKEYQATKKMFPDYDVSTWAVVAIIETQAEKEGLNKIEGLKKTIKSIPTNKITLFAHYKLGILLKEEGKYKEAEEEFGRLVYVYSKIFPKSKYVSLAQDERKKLEKITQNKIYETVYRFFNRPSFLITLKPSVHYQILSAFPFSIRDTEVTSTK